MFEELEKVKTLNAEIGKLKREYRDMLLYDLLLNGTVNYVNVSKMYVASLEVQNQDNLNKLVEAETIISEDLIDRKNSKKSKGYKEWINMHIHRALYFLNQSKRVVMDTLNAHFDYNEERDKKLSWYERNKRDVRTLN